MAKTTRISQVMLLLLFLTSALEPGCGQAPEQEDRAGQASSAVTAQCSDALISGGTCSGPWDYTQYNGPCYAQGTGTACGTVGPAKTCYPSCLHNTPGAPLEYDYYTQPTQRDCVTTDGWCDDSGYKPRCYPAKTVCTTSCVDDNFAGMASIAAARGWLSPLYTNLGPGPLRCQIRVQVQQRVTTMDPSCGAGYDCSTYATCRNTAFGLDPDRAACGAAEHFSSGGQTLAAVLSSDANAAVNDGRFAAPRCLTCETIATDTQANVQAKFACLASSLSTYPTGVASDPQLHTQVVQNMKLLFELKGDQLTPAQQTQAMGLYSSDPTVSYSCGNAFVAPTVTGACTTTALPVLSKTLTMCNELLLPHVAPAVDAIALPSCLSALGTIPQLSPTDCAQAAWLQASLDATAALTGRVSADLHNAPGSAGRVAELQAKLANIDAWWTAAKAVASPPPGNVMGGLSRVLGDFWKAQIAPQMASAGSETEAQLIGAGFVADREVLTAAYTNLTGQTRPPLSGAPLLLLTGDALHGLRDRLSELVPVHDMGCHFRQGGCAGAPSTPVSQLWALLGVAADAQKLSQAVLASTAVDPLWKSAFGALQQQHGAFEAAVLAATGASVYDPSALVQVTDPIPAGWPQGFAVGALAAVLRDGRAHSDAFAATGYFTPGNAGIQVGLDDSHYQAIANQLSTVASDLNSALAQYGQNRAGLVANSVANYGNQSTHADLMNQASIKDQKIEQGTGDLSGLRATEAADENAFASFMQGFQQLLPSLNASGQVVQTQQATVSVAARDRRFSLPTDLSGMAVLDPQTNQPWKVSGTAGDLLNFQITGQWSPTCALSLSRYFGAAGAMTGPEGYTATSSSGSYTATGYSSSLTNNSTISASEEAKICAGVRGAAGPMIFGSGIQAYFDASVCLAASISANQVQSDSTSTSGGSERRTTISFAEGLRSFYAPISPEPAGSLLLVQVPTGVTDLTQAIDIRVLHSTSSVLLAANADAYLVVNDAATNCAAPDPSALTVTMTRMTPVSGASQQIATAMAGAANQIAAAAPAIIAQGRVLPSQETLLRQSAYQQVYNQCNCSTLNGYPDGLHNLFDTYIAKELVHLEREVELVNIQRGLHQTMLELAAIATDDQNAQGQSRLLALNESWPLRDLDGTQLSAKVGEITQLAIDWLYPYIQLRNPETMSAFSSAEQTLINQLTAVDPSQPIASVASTALSATQAIQARLGIVRGGEPTPTLQDVVLSVPRPGSTAPASLWRKLDAPHAAAIWAAIQAGQNPVLTISPADLYSANGGAGGLLACDQSVPIINTFGLYLASRLPATYPAWSIPTVFDASMSFPEITGLQRFSFANANYLGPVPELLFGSSLNALSALQSYWAMPGRTYGTGLSPFTSLTLNVQSFFTAYPVATSNPLLLADELIIVLRLAPRQEAPGVPMPGVIGCP